MKKLGKELTQKASRNRAPFGGLKLKTMSTYKLEPIATHVLAEAFRHKADTTGDTYFEYWSKYWGREEAHARFHLLDKDQIQEFMEVLNWWCLRTEKYMKQELEKARANGRRLIASPSHPWLMSRDVALYLKEGDWLS